MIEWKAKVREREAGSRPHARHTQSVVRTALHCNATHTALTHTAVRALCACVCCCCCCWCCCCCCQVEDDNCNMAAHIEKNNTVISITWDTSMASR